MEALSSVACLGAASFQSPAQRRENSPARPNFVAYGQVVTYRQADTSDIPCHGFAWGAKEKRGRASADRMARYLEGLHHPQHALARLGLSTSRWKVIRWWVMLRDT